MRTQIPIGLCVLVLGICLGLGIGVWQCEWIIRIRLKGPMMGVTFEKFATVWSGL